MAGAATARDAGGIGQVDLFERDALEVGAALQEPRQPIAAIGPGVQRAQHAGSD